MAKKHSKKTPKSRAWDWCSKYVRLEEAIEYCKKYQIDTTQFNRIEDLPVKCCTCGKVKSWIYMDCGHFVSRGLGGRSGVYFDRRNLHAQSKDCNAWEQGAPEEYEKFMLEKYGQDVIDELRRKDKIPHRISDVEYYAMAELYKQEFSKLKQMLKEK